MRVISFFLYSNLLTGKNSRMISPDSFIARTRQRIAGFLAKSRNWSQWRFARNRRFERDLLTTLTISTMPLNGGEHDARYMRERISLRFARLWETGSRVRHRRVQCTLRARRGSRIDVVPSIETTRRPFRYKFR